MQQKCPVRRRIVVTLLQQPAVLEDCGRSAKLYDEHERWQSIYMRPVVWYMSSSWHNSCIRIADGLLVPGRVMLFSDDGCYTLSTRMARTCPVCSVCDGCWCLVTTLDTWFGFLAAFMWVFVLLAHV
ncbi:hypothetical protein ACI65C_008671 [Semiaphis heraclei]